MQKITRDILIEKASELLSNGTVSCVLGWRKGEFGYDQTPSVFKSVDEMKESFVFDDFRRKLLKISCCKNTKT